MAKQPKRIVRAGASKALTVRESLFIDAYIEGRNGTKSALAAGCPPKAAAQQANAFLNRAHVREEIERRLAARSAKIEMSATELIDHMSEMVRADARELSTFRRHACRYCWGEGHRYQFTAPEWDEAQDAHARRVEQFVLAGLEHKAPKIDPKGGVGYTKKREPHPECPACFGDGEGDVVIPDMRKLSPAAARMFAGIKKTKDGIEVKTYDKIPVLNRLASHFGIGKETEVGMNVSFTIIGDPAAKVLK